MRKYIFNKYWLVFSTIVFAFLFVFLVENIYQNTLNDTKRNHQEQQLEMAKTAAQGIDYLLEHLAGDMKFTALNYVSSDKTFKPSNINSDYFNIYDSSLVKSVIITDPDGIIRHSAGNPVPEWILPSIKEIIKLVQVSEEKKNYWLSPVIRDESIEDNTELFLIMISPILPGAANYTSNLSGYIGYIISFDSLVDRFIKPLRLSKSDFAWVMDGRGRLIYHPNHKEMLFRSISDTTFECTSCHSSFNIPKSIVNSKKSSIGEYSVIGDEPPKIFAYFPIKVQNQRWILVISTFLSDVTESLREKFRLFFIIGFVILGVIILFSVLIYYMNSKRIRAEEANLNLEKTHEFQEQLNQASKMASIGELVDTVAHEINTPVGIIAAHTDALILKNDHSTEIADALRIIKKQTQRISDYTRTILNYSQSIPYNPERIDIRDLISESVFLLNHRFRAKKISVKQNIQSEHVKVFADRRQMEQVFINLLNNAVAAIDDNGEIIISLKKLPPDLKTENKNGEEKILIAIKDNGIGIPEDHLQKIFDPFFSTKSKSEGTGLGLAIAKAITIRHKGKIEVISEAGNGATFNIILPVESNKSHREI